MKINKLGSFTCGTVSCWRVRSKLASIGDGVSFCPFINRTVGWYLPYGTWKIFTLLLSDFISGF